MHTDPLEAAHFRITELLENGPSPHGIKRVLEALLDDVRAMRRRDAEREADRQRVEASLRESEERFSSAFKHAPIGMALVGLDGRSQQVNRALCEMLGYSEPELLAKPVWELTDPDDMAVTIDHLRRMVAGEADTWQLEKRYVHRLGHVVWGLSSTCLVRDPNGHPLYVMRLSINDGATPDTTRG